jgi:hypothetical protein
MRKERMSDLTMGSSLSSREIVRRCIEFDDPPRIGLHFNVTPIDGRTWPQSDFALVGYGSDPESPPAPGEDEWGLQWESFDPTGENMGQAKNQPLGGGWDLLESYRFPDFAAPARYAQLPITVERAHTEGKYVYGHIPALMTIPGILRGLENWFMDHALYPEELGHLLDLIVDARLGIIREYARAGVDGVITWDDMGTNESPMVSPQMFRDIYLPRYRSTCDALHEHGMHFIHHCCGQVRPYVEMFIEAGCDVLQLDQPTLMGIDWLAEHAGGRLCFWNPVDIQTTIGSGDLEAIRDEAHHQVWALGNYGGGFMVKAYQQPNAIGMTAEQSQAQYDAFIEYGHYPLTVYPPQ